MDEKNSIVERVRKFVFHQYPMARLHSINNDHPLLEGGIVDSLGVLDLVRFMEEEFHMSISDEDLSPENFQSIRHLSNFIEKFVDKGSNT